MFSCSDWNQSTEGKINFQPNTVAILTKASLNERAIDSLKKEALSNEKDTLKLGAMLQAGRLLKHKDLQNVLSDVITNAKTVGYNTVFFAAILSKERQFAKSAFLDSVIYYHQIVDKEAAEMERPDVIAESMINLAIAYEMKEHLHRSDSISLEVLKFIKQKRIKNTYLKALALYQLGINKNIEFDNAGALSYLKEAADCAFSINNYELAGDIYFRMGECYIMESDYNNALEAYGKSVANCRKSNDEMTLSSDFAAIGEIYMQKGDYKKSYKNLYESVEIAKRTNYAYQEAYTYGILGALTELDSNFTKSLEYLEASNRIYESFLKKEHQGEILLNKLNIGSVNISMGNFREGMKILKEVNNQVTEEEPALKAEVLCVMADAEFRQGHLQPAQESVERALLISRGKEIMDNVRDDYKLLYKIFERKGQFKEAFRYHKLFTELDDSLTNKTQIKKFAELENEIKENQLRSDHDKTETLLRSEKMQKENELKRQRVTNIITGVGLILVLIFSIFIYRSLKENKRKTKIISEQKKEVEIQKAIIEDQKKEVLDSIQYAKRIQEAILPSDDNIKTVFPDSFVCYKPKDIVAGDFYWLVESENYFLIAAADCTGHGVPGAMVSVVCSNALNRAAKELSLDEPGLILDKVREMIIETFIKGDNDVKDGMDISLLAVPRKWDEGGLKIKWAGANNPLWYISENKLHEIKGNKQPVGTFIKQEKFCTVTLDLKRGDELFLITDGFADQFGGPKGKKFKYQQLKETLLVNSSLGMQQQKEILNRVFEDWKGNLAQIDDVTIIGIRL